ncbi:MAG: lactate racemase domain-containing protein, partial [Clostridiales bacterium]|nr:lactate racemase domain-containing protein [Clostridiales bacterium]
MPLVRFPYGKGSIEYNFPDKRFNGELVSRLTAYRAPCSQEQLAREAIEHPIGVPRLSVMAEGKKNVVII